MADDLQSLLDKAARLKRRIEFRKTTDKALAKRFEALTDEIKLRVPSAPEAAAVATKTQGGGTSWTFPSVGGATVRVTQPAAKLLGKISGELVARLKKICGRKFSVLFVTHYTCAGNFRQLAHKQLEDKKTAMDVIAMCEEAAKPQVVIS
ncbi:MAG: hypothetical protein V7609_2090 [Verrucomicrobiota bacterium]